MDESKMEQAMATLAHEAESLNEEDPRQAGPADAETVRHDGSDLGPAHGEALHRMGVRRGPEQIEAEMGDLLEDADPFSVGGQEGGQKRGGRPRMDDTCTSSDSLLPPQSSPS